MIWGLKKSAEQFPHIVLNSARVSLRPPNIQDHAQWSEVRRRCREYLQPFEPLWNLDSLSLAHYERRLDRQAREWALGHGHAFLIFTSDQTRLIGGMNINNICRGAAQYASLGYWIDESVQGQGYMSEALKLTLNYCFTQLKLHRVNASTLPHNQRSRNLLLSCGFEEEGFAKKYLQINGAWQDHVLYGLPLESWAE